MTRKVLFGCLREKKRHFGVGAFLAHSLMITASCHPIKVLETIKGIIMFIVVYDHVIVIYF
jgi:hypothetical protein